MAFSLGLLYLFQRRFYSPLLPGELMLRKLNQESIFLEFVLFSLWMQIGGIWAYEAWGYWFSWNIKGIWSFLIWLFYAGMCHAKFIRRRQGTGYALLSILGFAVVLFTYLGIVFCCFSAANRDRYSSLTINYDPGAQVSAAGGILTAMGCLLAPFSLYRNRKRQDRPEIGRGSYKVLLQAYIFS